jgi:uncharacterized protein (TIGR03435 family)
MLSAVLNHLWQSTLFVGLAALINLALRKNAARTRYAVWLVASIKFLVPLALLINLGSRIEWHTPLVIARTTIPATIEQASRPFVPSTQFFIPESAKPHSSSVPAILFFVWMLGSAAIAVRWAHGWRQMRAIVRGARPASAPMGIQAKCSRALIAPGVFGIVHPVLLLPEGIEESLTDEQLEAIVEHELCHVRRRDNLTAGVYMLVETAFWFHPLVWWLGARLVEERERACDEEVLRRGSDRQTYAESILKVCEIYSRSPLECASSVSGANLSQRIEEIMTHRLADAIGLPGKLLLAAAALLTVLWPLTIGLINAPTVAAQSTFRGAKFELASIRPCTDGGRSDMKMGPAGGTPTVSPGHLNTGCAALGAEYPMAGLIQRIYGRLGLGGRLSLGSALPISGGPSWIYSDRYLINANASDNAGKETMEGPMLQALLEDRFKLRVHREARQVPVYALEVARSGPKLRPPDETCIFLVPGSPSPVFKPGQKPCTDMIGRKGPNTFVDANPTTLDSFCKLLGLVLDRPVIDRTGIAGKYSFKFEFLVDQSTPGVLDLPGAGSEILPAASIFTAVQEQLGLKLVPMKGPRDYLVIDRIERPSEN